MGWLRRMAFKLAHLMSGRRADREFDDEVELHLTLLADRFVRRGLSPDAARAAACRQFGHRTSVENARRDLTTFVRLESAWQDVRLGARQLRRSPWFCVVAVLLLALGIGANTAILSVLDDVVFRPLPVRSPRELALVSLTVSPDATFEGTARLGPVSLREFLGPNVGIPASVLRALRQFDRVFADVIATSAALPVELALTSGADDAAFTRAAFVTPNYFSLLGVHAASGRVLQESDAGPVAVISHRLWQQTFGNDPRGVGRIVRLNGVAVEIVGVAAPEFEGISVGDPTGVWLPIGVRQTIVPGTEPRLTVLGRLQPDATLEQAQQHVRAMLPALGVGEALGFPTAQPGWFDLLVSDGSTGASRLRDRYAGALAFGVAASGLVLLITCANLATLLLARGAAGRHQIRVQLSLGAARGRLIRQMFAEYLALGALGGMASLTVAWWVAAFVIATLAGASDALPGVESRLRLLVLTAIGSVVSTAIFGVVPAIRATRPDAPITFNERMPAVAHVDRASRLVLVPLQVAVSMVLLVCALLFLRTLGNLNHQDVGFSRDELLLVQFDLGHTGYRSARLASYADDVETRLRSLPGVLLTATVTAPPFAGLRNDTRVEIPGYTAAADESYFTSTNLVGPEFIATAGIRMLHGRAFDARDRNANSDTADGATGRKVAIVNQRFARKYFGLQDAIGKQILVARAPVEIVGVAADVRFENLRDAVAPAVYMPVAQDLFRWRRLAILVRSRGAPDLGRLAPAIRAAVRGAGDGVRVARIEAVETLVEQSVLEERLTATVATAGGGLALVLVSVGLFGMVAYASARRSREFGVRIALGAQRSSIIRMVMRETLATVVAGIAVGALLAWASAQMFSSRLFGVGPADPFSLGAAATLIFVITLLAAFAPAWRATRIDPVGALRQE